MGYIAQSMILRGMKGDVVEAMSLPVVERKEGSMGSSVNKSGGSGLPTIPEGRVVFRRASPLPPEPQKPPWEPLVALIPTFSLNTKG